jgi:tRNA-specific 2-thiouridylase
LNHIAVALSGGVDSSVAALKLLEQGEHVVGLTMKMGWGPSGAVEDAAQAASQLEIEHKVVEVKNDFTRLVLKPVVAAYVNGRTPNPCALCNPGIKFPLLLAAAREAGCDYLATGHYARLAEFEGVRLLAQAFAGKKSQAYFLARLGPGILERLCFPLGEMNKGQVRKLARDKGLISAERPDSQEVCFLPPGGWDELVAGFGRIRTGPVEDLKGRELGRHQGLHRYTIGQRRGLGIALGSKAYVVELDPKRAAVILGPQEALISGGLEAEDALWLLMPERFERLTVRIRYAHPGVGCRIETSAHKVRVIFDEPQRAVAPGQLAVFFHEDLIIGSAWITRRIESPPE